jgi:hypothetical protein
MKPWRNRLTCLTVTNNIFFEPRGCLSELRNGGDTLIWVGTNMRLGYFCAYLNPPSVKHSSLLVFNVSGEEIFYNIETQILSPLRTRHFRIFEGTITFKLECFTIENTFTKLLNYEVA